MPKSKQVSVAGEVSHFLWSRPLSRDRRLYEITVEFHGEIGTELRLAVRSSLVESLRACSHLIVLEKEISNLIQTRSVCHRRESRGTGVDATSMSPFLQHRFWRLTKDDDVLPLLTKRRCVYQGRVDLRPHWVPPLLIHWKLTTL